MHSISIENPVATIHEAYIAMQSEKRPPRQRDAAARLGVSEAELVAAHCQTTATRLRGEWLEILNDLASLGTVMALTRNEHIVIEKDGVYGEVQGHAHVAMMRHGSLDLRFFCSRWAFAFACEDHAATTKRSLQFFDASGTAVHKVHLRESSDVASFASLVAKYQHADQSGSLSIEAQPTDTVLPDASIDVDKLRGDWDAMTEVHQFFGILKQHQVSRQQALRLAGETRARKVSRQALRDTLTAAAKEELSIMIFVGNRGCIEIHSGPVRRIVEANGWLNVLDDGFNLHAKSTGIAEAWVVHKPSEGRTLRSLEVYSEDGENTALLFVNREAGETHIGQWNQLLGSLES